MKHVFTVVRNNVSYSATVDHCLVVAVLTLCQTNERINAIKLVRSFCGVEDCGLFEAREIANYIADKFYFEQGKCVERFPYTYVTHSLLTN